MSLRVRIAAAVAAVVTVVVVVVGVLVHRSTEAALVSEVDGDLVERVEAIGRAQEAANRAVARFSGLTRAEQFRARNRTDPFYLLVGFDAYARVVDRQGSVKGVLDTEFTAPTDVKLLRDADKTPVLAKGKSLDGASDVRVVTVALPQGDYLQLARPLDEVDAALSELRRRTVLIGGVAVAAAAVVAWFIASRMAKPIRQLTDAAEHVASTGDLSWPVGGSARSGAGGEVRRLSASFTTMLGALSFSRRQQQRLVTDASHELRTPLTSLRTNVDVLRRHIGSEAAGGDQLTADILDDIGAELGELSGLVAELVDLAVDVRSEEEPVSVTLEEVARPVVERARRRSGREIQLDVARSAVLEGRPEALARAVRNLLENAVKFSPPAEAVTVEVDGGTLTVHDSGPGIPEAERQNVFDRFHRLESTSDRLGSGLGLSIVQQVAEAHDGKAFVEDSPRGGAAVGFRLPTVDD